jgi:hypothetical protein
MKSEKTDMRTYLSVDLDYWNGRSPSEAPRFFAQVLSLRLPIVVACEHHHLLSHVNKTQCDTLINVDYHSDVVDTFLAQESCPYVSDGTWVNGVLWRHRGRYEWRCPGKKCLSVHEGYCHEIGRNPFRRSELCGWRECKYRVGLGDLRWGSIVAVGVSVSPYWLEVATKQLEIIDTFGVRPWLSLDAMERERVEPIVFSGAGEPLSVA